MTITEIEILIMKNNMSIKKGKKQVYKVGIDRLLTKEEVQSLVADISSEDVFEYLNGLEVLKDGIKYYKLSNVQTYINRS